MSIAVDSITFHCILTHYKKKLAITNRSRFSCAHNASRASVVTP